MRNLVTCIIIIIAINTSLNAQDKDRPWMIGAGVSGVDYYPTSIGGMPLEDGGDGSPGWFEGWFDFGHYNFGGQLFVSRYISDSFNGVLSFSFTNVEKFGSIPLESKISQIATDLYVTYNLNKLFGQTGFFEPYLLLGGSYISQNGPSGGYAFNSAMALNVGLGAKFWISDSFGVRIQPSLKYFFNDGSFRHFQHTASLVYKFGSNNDSDNDGISNKDDACPETFGLAEFNGCPDSDGDGIIDSQDACPYKPGIEAERGCPERDNDADGVVDSLDKCKYVAGDVDNDGCPWPDTDGDGVADKDDECPEVFGSVTKNGCPEEVSDEALEKIKELARTLYFETDKAVINEETQGRLDLILSVMKQYPTAKFSVEGHTDNEGSEYFNQILSEDRANAVRRYLITNGINADNITAIGFGGANPIESNATTSGRAINRRVEIKLVK